MRWVAPWGVEVTGIVLEKKFQLWERDENRNNKIILKNKVQVLCSTVQTDDEITEYHAANAAAVVFETQTVNTSENLSPPGTNA